MVPSLDQAKSADVVVGAIDGAARPSGRLARPPLRRFLSGRSIRHLLAEIPTPILYVPRAGEILYRFDRGAADFLHQEQQP